MSKLTKLINHPIAFFKDAYGKRWFFIGNAINISRSNIDYKYIIGVYKKS
jgi:hypothetical protein